MRAWTVRLLVLALLTGVLTYPLACRADRVGPVNFGDGHMAVWNVAWVARALVRDPLNVYDANIFAPRPGTLAYSEANIVAGVLAIPAWWTTGNAYFAYNTAILLAFFLASAASYALARRVCGEAGLGQGASLSAAALIAAIAFPFAPLVVVRYAHVQLLMTLGLPLTLLAFHRLVERQTVTRAVALAASLALSALCSGYYGIAAGIAVGLGFVYYAVVRGLWRQPRYFAAYAGSVALAAILVVPFFLPYLHLESGGTAFRSIEETRRYSADWRSYLMSTAHVQRSILEVAVPFERSAFPERILFPGFLVCALAAVAAASAIRSRARGGWLRPDAAPDPGVAGAAPETVGFYALLAIVAAWLSFGPAAGLYWLAYELLPGFSLTRAPARLGILVLLALTMLGSIGAARVSRWLERRRQFEGRSAGAAFAAIACLLLVVELAAIPLDLRPALPMPQPHRTLATQPEGAVAEFPYFYRERDLYRNCLYMLYSTAHWHPLVNGYSDAIPKDYRETVVAISTFPSREAFRLLRERGTRYAIFHLNLYDRRSREKLLDAIGRYKDYLRPLDQSDDILLYEITAWPQ